MNTNLAAYSNSLLLIVVVTIVLIVGAVAIAILKPKSGGPIRSDVGAHYSARPTILTPAERSFAGVLDGAMPDGVTWLAKVRLGDIVEPRKGLAASQRTSALNRVNQKHVDFLLVRVTDFAPLAGIELDDRSHDRADRKDRDRFVDEVFRMCGVPLLHEPARAAYHQAELRARIAGALGVSPVLT